MATKGKLYYNSEYMKARIVIVYYEIEEIVNIRVRVECKT
jgi:uncharacterized protein YheU (UPF0270 family)